MIASLLIVGAILMSLSGPPAAASELHADGGLLLSDFTTERSDLDWYVLNDNVMGGRSEGTFRIEGGELYFAGSTNTRGGGFSSIRTRPVQLDLSKFAGIRLQVRGDGRRYTWRLATNARWRGRQVSYWADFDTRDGAWSTVNLPFSGFIPRFRGTTLDGPELNPEQITEMGLMIYDKLDGPFELRLASVQAYAAQEPFTLEQCRWKNRVLVVNSQAREEPRLAALQAELTATSDEFADRDMVLVTLLDTGTSMAGDRELTAAEAAEARADLRLQTGSFALQLIGKDGSIKLATESATSISEIYALIDTMPMRQSEQADR